VRPAKEERKKKRIRAERNRFKCGGTQGGKMEWAGAKTIDI
jgi:hypothetical protein